MKKILTSTKTPAPIGPYSVAVNFHKLIFTTGQIPLNKNGEVVGKDIKEQTRQVMENLKNILDENNSSMDNAIKTTVFLKDINDFAGMNEVYAEYFKQSQPARSTVEVSRLPKDTLLEIDLIAYINE